MPLIHRHVSAWICTLALAFLAGCGGGDSDAPKLAPAAGIVQFKGSPVTDAMITFYPEKGPVAIGRTDAKGAFQVKTNGQLGAVIGKNRVTVSSVDAAAETPPMDGNEIKHAVKSRYSAKYNDPKTTDLVIDLTNKGNSSLVLDLTE